MIGKFRVYPKEDGFVSFIWLIFILIPIIAMFPYDTFDKQLALFTLGIFVVTYRNCLFNGKWFPFWMALMYGISLFYTIYFGYIYLFIYPAWMIGFIPMKKHVFKYYYIALLCMLTPVPFSLSRLPEYVTQDLKITIFVYGFFICAAPFAGRSIRKQAELRKQIYQSTQRMEYVIKQEERYRIARDLHDTLGQSLSIMTIKAELAGKLVDKDQALAKKEIAEVAETSRGTLQTVREIVSSMRHVLIAEEMITIEKSLRDAKIILATEGEELTGEIATDLQNTVSYCLRECVTNVIRHSRASHCRIIIEKSGVNYTFTVEDDGKGMKDLIQGNGLTGLKERIESVCGKLEFTQKNGMKVLFTVPVDKKEEKIHD
ncbi:hypothetical protein UAW_02075 [Enterococcus haemoperoxidus ATCC BAA-382]|uniref:histidine kinase n=1 Tax=Enterococcus haemoperoxidus ATCC BAA-382 TaxID=1158608 RepID=R2SQD6_9ENTE|nr:hypothetical protein UAW_02075 [Enterococcus haemoperoxidus ATCC BAA-382]EOT60395.1 hypothetical protein I583_03041 [Enterococcus haemoperoxidus ATCC BAA-382]